MGSVQPPAGIVQSPLPGRRLNVLHDPAQQPPHLNPPLFLVIVVSIVTTTGYAAISIPG